jgi:hypothetical protein
MAIRNSQVVIVFLSRQSASKIGYVQKEIRIALDVADQQPEGTIFLIPLRIEDCEVPQRLSRFQWVDLFEPRGYEMLLRALHARSKSAHRNGMAAAPVENFEEVTVSRSVLDELRGLELQLREYDVIQFVKQQAVGLRAQFAADLATLSASIGAIENAQPADVSSRLDALSGALKAGIKELHDSLDALDRTLAIFADLGTVVGLAAKVAGLAAA